MKDWNWTDDECLFAFWEAFRNGEMFREIKTTLERRFDNVPSASTFGYRIDRQRIRAEFVRVAGDASVVDDAFSRHRARCQRQTLGAPRGAVDPPPNDGSASEPVLTLPERPRWICIGKEDTCTNRKVRGNYCGECGVGIYQSPEERERWNHTVDRQVAYGLSRYRK